MSNRRLGVYMCYCGGNISDYVDVERVRETIAKEPGVVVAKTALSACSDASQQEMVQDIKEHNLDGLVVASCSPKLHMFTFRAAAKRAGLNPYQYTQVNVREQCSWTHTDDREGATRKEISLIRAGIGKTSLTEPLEPIRIDTVPKVLVVGGGIAGLRAAIGLADIGLSVLLIEKSPSVGGRVNQLGIMYPHGKDGKQLIAQSMNEIKKRKNITLLTNAELVGKSGSIGDFTVKIRVSEDEITANVGTIIIATGFDSYHPKEGEYGYGIDGVVALPEFKELLDKSVGVPTRNGKEIRDIVYIYCVGSRQDADLENPNRYCSRFCCTAAVHSSIVVSEKNPNSHQYHLFRDIRTYGKYELLYGQSRDAGSTYLRFGEDEPPVVEKCSDGKVKVTVRDLLTFGEEVEIKADVVVLVTGMVPRKNEELVSLLKLPVGRDRFFNEIHPKLRPVETMVDGVLICGTCQGPKNSSETVASALAAATQSAAILKKGYVELDPLMAWVNPELCDGCLECVEACPYSAIEMSEDQGKKVATVNKAGCKGCGGCVPVCPREAIDLKGYTDAQIKSMIDGFLKEIV
ncbi:MAG TPA: CoB--CoM heterodisulfide reductase iron-sulfur subunit A family protein [Spirochaetia bacterium]|nr:CoB--CoM heterodisulfide reductase iron-sulfur subunit A family protein [Spirochaetia bacterium]